MTMRVRMFKPQFATLVLSGAKRQTIRPTPKRMPRAGDHESWREWSGLPYRSKQNELAKVELTEVRRISMNFFPDNEVVYLDDQILPREQYEPLAARDGFASFVEMAMWFFDQYGESFAGILIKAKDL